MRLRPHYIAGLLFVLFPFAAFLGGWMHESQTMGVVVVGALALAWLAPHRAVGLFLALMVFWVVWLRYGLAVSPAFFVGWFQGFVTMPVNKLLAVRYAEALHGFYHVAAGVAVYAAVSRLRVNRLEFAFNCVAAASALLAAWTVLQALGIDPLLVKSGQQPDHVKPWMLGSLTGHPNFLAAYLAVSLPFFWRPGWRWGLLVLVPVLVAQQTTGGIMAATAGLGYLAWRQWGHDRLFWWGVTAAAIWGLVFVLAVDPIQHSIVSRWATWQWALVDPSVLGHGPGTWGIVLGGKLKNAWVFNEYLQVFLEMGAVGLVAVGWLSWSVLASRPRGGTSADVWRHHIVKAAVLAIAVNCTVNPFFHIPTTALLGAVVLGLWEVSRAAPKKKFVGHWFNRRRSGDLSDGNVGAN